MQSDTPLRVAITGAAGMIGSVLCPMVAQGAMFGPSQKVILHLVELPFAQKALEGLCMELEDGAYPLLEGVVPCTDAMTGFKDIDVAILVGARPRGPGMERKDLLTANAAIFKEQGACLEAVAKKTCKVLVVGNPANTNCLIASQHAPSIPKENFSALTRLDLNRALGLLSKTTGVPVSQIENVYIWGNHSSTMYPDTTHTKVAGEKINLESEFLRGEFVTRIQKRGAEIIATTGKSSVASAANATCDHIKDWFHGTAQTSMAVSTDGNPYGIQDGLFYSFPVSIKDGKWSFIPGLEIDAHSKEMMAASEAELVSERDMAFN